MQLDNVFLGSRSIAAFSVALVPAATAAASSVEQAFTMPAGFPAFAVGDIVDVSGPGSGNALGLGGARINATGQLVIQFINPTAGVLTHAAGSFAFTIARA